MADIRILREDINLRTPALDEALGSVTGENDFDAVKVARESLIRIGDLKEHVEQPKSALRSKLKALRESLE